MKETTDFIPAADQRRDFNKQLCALVKVQVVDEITDVEGNIMGDIVNKGVEKWVYMAKGSRNMKIHLKNNLPAKIMFRDYGINGLVSNRIYELVIKDSKTEAGNQKLIINYTPADATVLIDSKIYTGNGRIEAELSTGEHKYLIAAKGYYSAESIVILNANTPRQITENLISENTTAITEKEENYQTTTPSNVIVQQERDTEVATENKIVSVGNVSFKMIHIKGGTFDYGDTKSKVIHRATLSDFYIGETEVTQELWQNVMNANPSKNTGLKHPVENISWNDCINFIKELNHLTGLTFRLPTEIEWEYAAKGGNKSHGYKYAGSNKLKDVAVYSEFTTSEVASKAPNELGIYDMTGNVYEWCQDWYGEYTTETVSNPTGASEGTHRVMRGGCSGGNTLLSNFQINKRMKAKPDYRYHFVGLRLVLQ